MKKNLAKKITLSILAGAMLMSSSVAWATITEGTATGTNAIAIGEYSTASGANSTAVGSEATASVDCSNAVGYKAAASGYASNAIGRQAEASGSSSNAMGFSSMASGANSNAVGNNAKAIGEGSNAIGAYAAASGESSIAIGTHATANNLNSVALGAGSVTSEDNTVSIGTSRNKRRLTNLAAGVNDTDAVNVAQLKEKADKADTLAGYGITDAYTKTEIDGMLGGSNASVAGLNQRLEKTNAKINKVGAGAAALAALHPLDYDPDDKLTFSAGMGNYAGENAAALGAFYRPNEKFMVSLGGTMGNGENMVNLGLSIGLDKASGFAKLSKRELIQKVNVMEAKYEAVEAENEAMKAEIIEMKAMLQELLAKK